MPFMKFVLLNKIRENYFLKILNTKTKTKQNKKELKETVMHRNVMLEEIVDRISFLSTNVKIFNSFIFEDKNDKNNDENEQEDDDCKFISKFKLLKFIY
jgi:hypothetical protein